MIIVDIATQFVSEVLIDPEVQIVIGRVTTLGLGEWSLAYPAVYRTAGLRTCTATSKKNSKVNGNPEHGSSYPMFNPNAPDASFNPQSPQIRYSVPV